MAGNIGEWEGFIEEHNLEELYIFDDDEEVSHIFENCKILPISRKYLTFQIIAPYIR